jgi:hypothetical protein
VLLSTGRWHKPRANLATFTASTIEIGTRQYMCCEGGPIIEREIAKIERFSDALWEATAYTKNAQDIVQYGPTPLIAAMRCYVASKLGDEVEIPEELV